MKPSSTVLARFGVQAGLLLLMGPGWLFGAPSAGTAGEKAPPPPPGYKSSAEVMAAIAAGKVKLISQPKELPAGVAEQKNIEYCKLGDHSLQLDLYLPEKIVQPVPLLVFIHGGGWVGGSRDIYKDYTVR